MASCTDGAGVTEERTWDVEGVSAVTLSAVEGSGVGGTIFEFMCVLRIALRSSMVFTRLSKFGVGTMVLLAPPEEEPSATDPLDPDGSVSGALAPSSAASSGGGSFFFDPSAPCAGSPTIGQTKPVLGV